MVADVNPFQYVLSRCIIGGKFNKWIVILQEFDLDFQSAKSKKSLVFTELILEFLMEDTVVADANPFQCVLSRHIIEGKFNKWIVILQEFDLDFQFAKSKISLVFT